jgi:hypothetical protein
MTSGETTAPAEGAAWTAAASGWVEHWDGSYRFENRFRSLIAAVP